MLLNQYFGAVENETTVNYIIERHSNEFFKIVAGSLNLITNPGTGMTDSRTSENSSES